MARSQYHFRIAAESPERLVFIDESRIDFRATYQLYGWAEKGQKAKVKAQFVRGARCILTNILFLPHLILHSYTILPALCTDGIIHTEIREGSYDGDAFISYIEDLLPRMNPWPLPRSILLMDNCAIHHMDDVAPLCVARYVSY